MKKATREIIKLLGGKHVATFPKAQAHGAFGAMYFAKLIGDRLSPAEGKRPGRPTDSKWSARPKVPMKLETVEQLKVLAAKASTKARKVSPMQVAAILLEEAVARKCGSL